MCNCNKQADLAEAQRELAEAKDWNKTLFDILLRYEYVRSVDERHALIRYDVVPSPRSEWIKRQQQELENADDTE
jgi:hypothetical protein